MQGYGFAVATGVIIASEMSVWWLAGDRVDAIVPAKKIGCGVLMSPMRTNASPMTSHCPNLCTGVPGISKYIPGTVLVYGT